MEPEAKPRVVVNAREIGRARGNAPGSTLIAVAGMHGNEPAGIEAARRVFARLERGDIELRGEVVVFAGNLAALQAGLRYQVKDLNRVWSAARVEEVRDLEGGDAEDNEQRELLRAIEAAIGRARGQVHLADFHTSSARGIPFVLFGDTLPQRNFVRIFPIPIIIGLEEQLDGVLTEYWTRRGCVTFAVEGGQHDDPASADSLEAVLWLSMREAGLIESDPHSSRALPEVTRAEEFLETRRGDLPRVLEVVSRRAITEADAFQMEPGFRNLDHAPAGRLLARDKNGEIRAPSDGMVILPLYQGLGADGFFWGRTVSQVRMKTSEVLRHLGVDRLLGFLPGVARDPSHPSRFILDTLVSRLYPRDVFHMFGYRRVRQRDGELTIERQLG